MLGTKASSSGSGLEARGASSTALLPDATSSGHGGLFIAALFRVASESLRASRGVARADEARALPRVLGTGLDSDCAEGDQGVLVFG